MTVEMYKQPKRMVEDISALGLRLELGRARSESSFHGLKFTAALGF